MSAENPHGLDASKTEVRGNNLGKSIRKQREALNMSQEDLAQMCMVSRVTISNWETGKTLPDIQSLTYLSEAFGITVNDLVASVGPDVVRRVSADRRELQLLNYALLYLLVLAIPLRIALEETVHVIPDIPGAVTMLVILFGVVAIIARMGVIHRKHNLGTDAQIADYLVGNIQHGTPSTSVFQKYRTELTVAISVLLCLVIGVALSFIVG